jgi:MoaA/NifB/PqqE/SkfB family radical SAM enzyme
MFTLSNIDEYQLEITSYCNAACPQCPRNINGYGINPHMPLLHLKRKIIDETFTTDLCSKLRQIFFCGSYGDPIMHPEFLDILRDFRRKNPTLWLYIHTNGGVHNSEYWAEIARIMNGYGQIDFGIDGLDDTLHIYRKNVKFSKVIENAKSFIAAGGRAQWNFIVFKHNEHQIDQAQQLSKQLGFFNILIRKTGRFFNHSTLEEMDRWPVAGKLTTTEYYLEPPSNKEYRNSSLVNLPMLKKQYRNMRDYFSTTPIHCDSLNGNKVAINAEGIVLPCNFFNHNLYDARFYNQNQLPCANDLSIVNNKNQVREFLEKYGLDNLNINHRSLSEIFNNAMWVDLVESFNKTLDGGRLFECSMTCGSKLKKVWDQGGSKKMSMLVTGGNRGLGLELVKAFNAESISRSNGYDITNQDDLQAIAELSLKYDIFVNNAFDGPPQEEWANFAQTNLYMLVYDLWKEYDKTGLIINIGSVGEKHIVSPEPRFETYRVSKSALAHASKQGTQAFKNHVVPFKTTLLTPDRLDTDLSRSRESWTGNGVSLTDLINSVNFIVSCQKNTVIEEITFYCDLNYSI